MTPSIVKPVVDEEEDLDGLDDVLEEFQTGPVAVSTPTTTANASSSTPLPSTTVASTSDDFPDPDSPVLGATTMGTTDDFGADFDKELQAGMANLLGEMDGEGGLDFKKIMEEIMKGEMGFPGQAGEGANEQDPAALLAAFGGLSTSSPTTSKSPSASTSTAPAVPLSYQETIAQAQSKLKSTSATAAAEAEASATAGMDPLAAMMAQMAGLDMGAEGGEEGLQGMLDEMMSQLMSRELLYEPLKDLSEKYPAYLAENKASLSADEFDRYTKQSVVVNQIVAKFDEPGADKEGPLSAAEEKVKAERGLEVIELVGKMNEYGAPPTAIMGEMPPGMDLAGGGMPKMPDCPVS